MVPFSMKKAKRQVSYARTRSKKMGITVNTLTVEQWVNALHSSGGVCHYCRQQVGEGALTPDHVKSLEKYGDNSIDNIVVACLPCQHSKGWQYEIPLYLQLGITKPDPDRRYYLKAIGHAWITTRYALRYLREKHGMKNVSEIINTAVHLYAKSKMKEVK